MPRVHRAAPLLLALGLALAAAACGDDGGGDDPGPNTADAAADVVTTVDSASDPVDPSDSSDSSGATTEVDASAPDDTTGPSADAAASAWPDEFEPGVELFECLTNWPKVRNFRVANAFGDLEASLAVANGEVEGPYPPGTIIQLVPFEAMVKRLPGWSPTSADWEFFFLDASTGVTTIVERGVEDVFNSLGGNCFDCHVAAADHDFVCESGFGCVELPFTPEVIADLQEADPRCE